MPPPVDPWIERPFYGDPVCARTTLEQKSTAISAPSGKPTERGPPALHMPGPWPPGWTSTGCQSHTHAPLMAPQGFWTDMSFCFEHYQDNLTCIFEILGQLMD